MNDSLKRFIKRLHQNLGQQKLINANSNSKLDTDINARLLDLESLLTSGQIDDAISSLRQIASRLIALGTTDIALDAFECAIELTPGHEGIHNSYIKALANGGDLTRLRDFYKKIIIRHKDNHIIWKSYSMGLCSFRFTLDALEAYEKSLELAIENHSKITSSYIDTGIRIASDLWRYNRSKRSIHLFKTLEEHFPDNFNLLLEQAFVLIDDRQFGAARIILEKAYYQKPDNPRLQVGFGRYYLGLRRFNDAITHFVKAKNSNYNDAELLLHHAEALAGQAIELIPNGNWEAVYSLVMEGLSLSYDYPALIVKFSKILGKIGMQEIAYQQLSAAVTKWPSDSRVHSALIDLYAIDGNTKKVEEIFKKALNLKCADHRVKRSYARALGSSHQIDKSITIFEQAIALSPTNEQTLLMYIEMLFDSGKTKKAFDELQTQRKHGLECVRLFVRFANRLTEQNKFEEALHVYNLALDCDPNNIITLTNYAKCLALTSKIPEAKKVFEKALQLESTDTVTLITYGNFLRLNGEVDRGLELLKSAVESRQDDSSVLSTYVNALMRSKRYKQALSSCRRLLELEPNNPIHKYSLSKCLQEEQQYSEALDIARQIALKHPENRSAIKIMGDVSQAAGKKDDALRYFQDYLECNESTYVSLQCARLLEDFARYDDAIKHLAKVRLPELPRYHANVIRLTLARLYYRIGETVAGDNIFSDAVNQSDDKDKTIIYSARSILATNPHSETAVDMLRRIGRDSQRYSEAMEMILLNASEEEFFNMIDNDPKDSFKDLQLLNRSIYHRIENEVSILKGIAFRLIKQERVDSSLVQDVIDDIEDIGRQIAKRKTQQYITQPNDAASFNEFGEIIGGISRTAHDISDLVNNHLAVIESKIRRALKKINSGENGHGLLQKLLGQVEITQSALNDLKSINEGITIRRSEFKVGDIFDKWNNLATIGSAQLNVSVSNSPSVMFGDEEKIKGIVNELVDNALKHNEHKKDLCISITSDDVTNPEGIRGATIPGEQRYLFIQISDNGKGVPTEKKGWIFKPLNTTATDGAGSGLGLFIARKVLSKLNGYIREAGTNGAKFEIYIPYLDKEPE